MPQTGYSSGGGKSGQGAKRKSVRKTKNKMPASKTAKKSKKTY